ncbi:MAG: serpin family protein [Planctomycetes bacterium]|nr:serpin family protein [Planctomycetota bacterium]
MKQFRKRGLWCLGLGFIISIVMGLAPEHCYAEPADPLQAPLDKGNLPFALDFFSALKQAEGNFLIAPYSLSSSLAMIHGGARGNTARQIAEVLRFVGEEDRLRKAFAPSIRACSAMNALWVRKGLSLLPEYLDLIHDEYGGTCGALDFAGAGPDARATINAWAAEGTGGKISELLRPEDLDSAAELVITNALYFHEDWAGRFDPKNTCSRVFEVAPDQAIQVPMMYQQSRFGYAALEEVRVLEIPYRNNELSMVVLLPHEIDGLESLEASLSVENLQTWLGALHEEKIGVFLPRFKMTSRFRLEETLAGMGMAEAFDPAQADFSGMTGWKGLFIDKIIHQTCLEVTEEGSEAAASSAITMKKGGITFWANHPFLFLVRDQQSGNLLFIGRMVRPG